MDMRISGSGNIPGGEYEKVSVSGSGRLVGRVKCKSFTSHGTVKGESIECAERMKTSGTARFSGDIKAKCVTSSGTFFCGGNLTALETITCSGTMTCQKAVKCNRLLVSGAARLGAGVEAEQIELRGSVKCEGLINAEEVTVKMDGNADIASIGGSRITVAIKGLKRWWKGFPLLCRAVKNAQILAAIEGDEISVMAVTCPRITGRTVTVGKHSCIGLVQYTEHIKIAKGARVEKVEKID